ncbi:MAG: ECF transporter S component [Firmicutes bacterium]|jgi:riboflavin transporter FmnP|nr:ECF transporter S component [Bacillota bacterium]
MTNVRRMTVLALLAAISFLLMFALEFPLPGFPPYLKYDPSDVCGLLAAFSFGPAAGFLVELIKSILFFLSGKSADGIVGAAAALVAGGSFVWVAGRVYALGKRSPVLALLAGTITMTVLMVTANYFIFLPLWGLPTSQVKLPLIIAMLGFNLVKGVITSILTLIIHQSLKGKIALTSAEARR